MYLSEISKVCLNNKYFKLYHKIIHNALQRVNPSLSFSSQKSLMKHEFGYIECHHILPKSIGCKNSHTDKNNIAILSAREHFICHYLLCKMFEINSTEWFSMTKAFGKMSSSTKFQNRYNNSRLFEYWKRNSSTIMGNCNKNTTIVMNGLIVKRIKKNELQHFLDNGWVHQHKISKQGLQNRIESNKRRAGFKWMTNQIQNIQVNPNDTATIELLKAEGYSFGRSSSASSGTKNKIKVKTNGKIQLVNFKSPNINYEPIPAPNKNKISVYNKHTDKLEYLNDASEIQEFHTIEKPKHKLRKKQKWINNGSISKMIDATSNLPDGWFSGRLLPWNFKIQSKDCP